MALDGLFLYSIVYELKNLLLEGRVNKINQPEKDEIILSISNNRKTYKLSISANAVYPKIHITNINKTNPLKAPMFCMVLRKFLGNSKLINIRQINTDRILFLDFETLDELGFNSIYSLIIEIMGRHSNITLVRQRDNVIIDSIKHVTPEINSFRCLYPGISYVFPPKSEKLNPFNYSYEDLNKYINNNSINFDKKFFSKTFTGISLQFSKEICYRIMKNNIEFNENNLKNIDNFIKDIFLNIKNNKFKFTLYEDEGIVKDFYCTKLLNLKDLTLKEYDSPSMLVQNYYFEKDRGERLNNKSSSLQKLININLDRCYKKLNILNNTLKECDKKERYKILGELLTANIYNLKSGDKEVTVLNYYSKNQEYITIKLKENKSPSENVQHYYKKYNKLKKSEKAATLQIKITKDEIEYLQSVLTNLKNAEDYESIDEIKKELMETGYIRFRKNKKNKKKESKPMHFISSEGIDIYVGKNNFQNDYLTLKFANKHDIWMHTKNIPGSHVIIKAFNEVSEQTLKEGANLAAFYSKSKDSSKVPVDYTEVKNVHKPNGAKPGMVIYTTNKTIYITPTKPELKKEN